MTGSGVPPSASPPVSNRRPGLRSWRRAGPAAGGAGVLLRVRDVPLHAEPHHDLVPPAHVRMPAMLTDREAAKLKARVRDVLAPFHAMDAIAYLSDVASVRASV